MINLRDIETKDLINELLLREEVRSMNIEKGETVKSVVFLTENQNSEYGTRYLRGYGPSIILEIEMKWGNKNSKCSTWLIEEVQGWVKK